MTFYGVLNSQHRTSPHLVFFQSKTHSKMIFSLENCLLELIFYMFEHRFEYSKDFVYSLVLLLNLENSNDQPDSFTFWES